MFGTVAGVGGCVVALHPDGSRVENHWAVREELLGFGLPVVHHRGRADDQRWECSLALLLGPLEDGKRLEGLAQSHVIGQDAVQAESLEKRKPVESLLLVGAKGDSRPQRCGKGHVFDLVEIGKLRQEGVVGGRTVDAAQQREDLDNLLPLTGRERIALCTGLKFQMLDGGVDLLELLLINADPGIPSPDPALPLGPCLQVVGMGKLNPVVMVDRDNLQDRPTRAFDDFDVELDLGGFVGDAMGGLDGFGEVDRP